MGSRGEWCLGGMTCSKSKGVCGCRGYVGMGGLQMLHNIFKCSEMLKFILRMTRNIRRSHVRNVFSNLKTSSRKNSINEFFLNSLLNPVAKITIV